MRNIARRIAGAALGVAVLKYRGPDREKILLDGAKKEGSVVFYTAYVKRVVDNYIKAWKAKYPDLKLDVIISTDQATGTRVITEHQAGVHAVDVISTSGTTKAIADAVGRGNIGSPFMDEYPVSDVFLQHKSGEARRDAENAR